MLRCQYSKMIYRFYPISIKILSDFPPRNGKANPQIHMKLQKALNSQYNLDKKTIKLEYSHFLTLKLTTKQWYYCTSIRQTYRPTEWIQSLEINSYIHFNWFSARAPRPFNGIKSFFNEWLWENWISTCKRMKWSLSLYNTQN